MRRYGEPDVYEMQTMIFGTNCWLCLVQFVKNKNAEDHKENYKEALEVITQNKYVDDYLDSTKTEEGAIKCIQDVIVIF